MFHSPAGLPALRVGLHVVDRSGVLIEVEFRVVGMVVIQDLDLHSNPADVARFRGSQVDAAVPGRPEAILQPQDVIGVVAFGAQPAAAFSRADQNIVFHEPTFGLALVELPAREVLAVEQGHEPRFLFPVPACLVGSGSCQRVGVKKQEHYGKPMHRKLPGCKSSRFGADPGRPIRPATPQWVWPPCPRCESAGRSERVRLAVVDAQDLADGRPGNPRRRAAVPSTIGPLLVGLADHLAALDAAADQDARPGARIVIAAGLGAARVDLRRPAELAHPDHQRVIEQTALFQVA